MEENANKLHFQCTDFNSSTRVTVYSEHIYVLFIKIFPVIVTGYHVDCWQTLVLLVAKLCTKFEACIYSRSEDISWGVKFLSWSHYPDHAPFRDGLSPTGWDMLW